MDARETALEAVRSVLRMAEGREVFALALIEEHGAKGRVTGEIVRLLFTDGSEMELFAKTFVPAFHERAQHFEAVPFGKKPSRARALRDYQKRGR